MKIIFSHESGLEIESSFFEDTAEIEKLCSDFNDYEIALIFGQGE